jgi:hypothetical protein
MTLTLTSDATDSIDLATFVEHLEHELDVSDIDGLIAAAPAFKRLLNNPRVLTDFIEAELRGWRDERDDHDYVGRTFIMIERPKFLVRANIWVAPDPDKPLPRPDEPGFGYLIPHDHNFAFLTGGYFGPGYTTNLFEYDYERVSGQEGEHVELRPLGQDTLPLGKMVLYHPSSDVHYQDHPAALSVSLNVVVPGPWLQRLQYLFDVESQTVQTVLNPAGARGATVCELATALGDGRTAALLADVAEASPNPRVRGAATRALCALESLHEDDLRVRARSAVRTSGLSKRSVGPTATKR